MRAEEGLAGARGQEGGGGEGARPGEAPPQAHPDEKQELLAKHAWSKCRKVCLLLKSPAKESSLAQQGPHRVLIQRVL